MDVAYYQITPSDKIKNDATTKKKTISNREQDKSTKEVKRRKNIHVDTYIVDISNENETTMLSQLYPESTIKE